MNTAWLEELLPRTALSSRAKICWILFFALFPLAYVGGILLEGAQDNAARIAGSQNRAASIRTAAQFAASKGVAVENWHRYAILETRDNLLAYYNTRNDPEMQAANRLAPAREVQVLFRSPDQSREFRVYLSLTGSVTGFDSGKSTYRARNVTANVGVVRIETNTTTNSDAGDADVPVTDAAGKREAESVARQSFAHDAALTRMVLLGPAKVTHNDDAPGRYDVAWDASPASLKGLTLHVAASVQDSQLVAQHVEAGVDKAHVVKKSKLPIVLDAIYFFFLLCAALYAMFRYAKRTLQKEVSHVRTLLVAALFAVSYSLLAYSLGVDQLATRVSGSVFNRIGLISLISSAIVIAILGLLVGIGYGSGEGELREAYPGKLTSLDALLAGRIFSRDVASSVLFGAAAAGWLLLAQQAVSHFLRADISALRSDVLTYTFARYPWPTLLLGRQYDSLVIAVTGLLLPASFLLRRTMLKQRRFFCLILFALFSVLADAAKYATPALALVATVVLVCALVLPFFAFDLLAAMVSLSALTFVNEIVSFGEVVASWTSLALWFAAFAAIMLAVAANLALHARPVREEDVRPLYARNLAERMAMQAEILAAREAQLRLLPQAAPELPGVQLAACCLPARGVGGDFYDFFRLDSNRLGIFVAQGGHDGLASALRIALAKGLLMHASQQAQSPTQIIAGVNESIAELLEAGSGSDISFAYGVMDTRRNLLNYARIGTSPRLLLYREGGAVAASSQLEREVTETKTTAAIYEGAAQARPGDFLIFVTDGLMSLSNRGFRGGDRHWLNHLVDDLGRPDAPLQSSLVAALAHYQNHASEDLTAVVLRIVANQPVAQEVVA